jgi:hypothetical protein
LPDQATILGTTIIIATGLYSLHRERTVRRTAALSARPDDSDPV